MSLLLFPYRMKSGANFLPQFNRMMISSSRSRSTYVGFGNTNRSMENRVVLPHFLNWWKPTLIATNSTANISAMRRFSSDGKDDRSSPNPSNPSDTSISNYNSEDFVSEPSAVQAEDPFGLLFEDGADGLGSVLPPEYQRDAITGRVLTSTDTSKSNVSKVSDREKRILNMDSLEHDVQLMDSVQKHWTSKGTDDETGLPKELNDLGERIRETNIATNVLGRSPSAQTTKEVLDDGSEFISSDETGFSQPLTMDEYRTFQKFMKTKHKVDVAVDDMPVTTQVKADGRLPKYGLPATSDTDPDNVELSLKWLTARAQRQMDETVDDNPYSDLMPGDLSPSRLVNRKRAKLIPSKELHFNNLALLQHFITPTGQIMNRAQTRLGARDQRRVARLIKRGRSIGVLPYVGQFKVENHGWLHSPDMNKERKWERTLRRRGLSIQKPTTRTQNVETEMDAFSGE
jgi:ribosomal protein S18